MSLAIAFKGPEGIVLAADSRVTLNAQLPPNVILPSTFDNATKLLKVTGQDFVGVVTYGLGAIGEREPRTAHSFMPEFEAELAQADLNRLGVDDFASRLSDFFMRQWSSTMPGSFRGPDMVFLIGGYDVGSPYGRVLELGIPGRPNPREWNAGATFGVTWGGQREFTDRLLQGFDNQLIGITQAKLGLADKQVKELDEELREKLSARIPYQFLPLQDCVDLAIFLIRTTIKIQTWSVSVRGVGGAIDVATITRTEGLKAVQQKFIRGEDGG